MLEEDPVLEAHRYKWRKVALGVLFMALILVIFRSLASSGNPSPAAAPAPIAAQ